MPLFSAFTPFGILRFKRGPSRGEQFYRAGYALKVDAFDMTKGSYMEAKLYAQSMAIARAREALERGFNQQFPQYAIELLPALEEDWSAIPGETDIIATRQNNVLAAQTLVRGAVQEAITTGLTRILGPHFLGLRTLAPAEITSVTPSGPYGPLFNRADLPFKLIRIKAPIAMLNTALSVPYENADVTAGKILVQAGDVFVIQPENSQLNEKVTILSATSSLLNAVFTRVHDHDCLATTQPFVNYVTTQRIMFVIVDTATSLTSELVRKVDEYMAKVSKSTDLWHVVQPTAPNALTFGGFHLDTSPIGPVTVGTFPILSPVVPIFSFLPTTKYTSQTVVKLFGQNLNQATAVAYVDPTTSVVTPLSYTIVSNYEIDTTWPTSLAPGVYPVRVSYMNPDGSTSFTTNNLTMVQTPLTVTGIMPSTGSAAGAGPCDIYGTGFLLVTNIKQNSTDEPAGWVIVNDTHISNFTALSYGPGPYPAALQLEFDDSLGNTAFINFTFT